MKRDVEFYNLDAVIAVGYRANSKTATDFASGNYTLKEYITKGFALNDEMLKNGRGNVAKIILTSYWKE